MSDLVRRDDLWAAYQQMDEPTRKNVRDMIRDAEAVDAVEVVRCYECKHWRCYGYDDIGECVLTKQGTGDTEYCSYGERRENDAAD